MLVLLLTIVGCARGFDRGALRDQLTHEGPAQISDADIQRALELRPQLTFPFRLAVYLQRDQVERRSYNDNVHNGSWRWEGGDKDSILATEKLRSEGVVSDMFLIPPARVKKNDLGRHTTGSGRARRTVVGLWLVPGTHTDALFVWMERWGCKEPISLFRCGIRRACVEDGT